MTDPLIPPPEKPAAASPLNELLGVGTAIPWYRRSLVWLLLAAVLVAGTVCMLLGGLAAERTHRRLRRYRGIATEVLTESGVTLDVIRHAGDPGLAVVDIFRVADGKIVEHWDVLQDVPEQPLNPLPMF